MSQSKSYAGAQEGIDVSLSKSYAGALEGIDASLITLEVAVMQGTRFFMVGLPDSAIKESQQRIEAALKYFGYRIPRKKVVINLAPADLRKEGSSYDLPIAIGILSADGQSSFKKELLSQSLMMGELSLDGQLGPIRGALSMASMAKTEGFKRFLLPKQNAEEASMVEGIDIIGIEDLQEAVQFLNGDKVIAPTPLSLRLKRNVKKNNYQIDMEDIKGQVTAKRALEIAAAGAHNVLMIGPPGAGKTLLGKSLPSILPALRTEEALEVTKVYSAGGHAGSDNPVIFMSPFRSPHHTVSEVGLVGGGSFPRPGEISLAHHGVLFLDELSEFKRNVLESLRQPMEDRQVVISRSKMRAAFPASFMLVASMNPCPCGYYNHPSRDCNCSSSAIVRYLGKISGPLLDRVDMHIEVTPLPPDDMVSTKLGTSSRDIRNRVEVARERQEKRFAPYRGVHNNSMAPPSLVRKLFILSNKEREYLRKVMETIKLSARAYDRILKVSRTIADLEGEENISSQHLMEAVSYRNLDRGNWAFAHTR
ncbi:MAG: YifB family Mg chelatase-like AAA ATPase [Cytophagales bacterium]|nr:YifB family Mg chelatase-like AAA ATPase [Cytophagales bacterium]